MPPKAKWTGLSGYFTHRRDEFLSQGHLREVNATKSVLQFELSQLGSNFHAVFLSIRFVLIHLDLLLVIHSDHYSISISYAENLHQYDLTVYKWTSLEFNCNSSRFLENYL